MFFVDYMMGYWDIYKLLNLQLTVGWLIPVDL